MDACRTCGNEGPTSKYACCLDAFPPRYGEDPPTFNRTGAVGGTPAQERATSGGDPGFRRRPVAPVTTPDPGAATSAAPSPIFWLIALALFIVVREED